MGFFDGTPKKEVRYYDSPNVDPTDKEGKGKAGKVDKQLKDALEHKEYAHYLREVGVDDGWESDMAMGELGEAEIDKTAHQDSLVSYLRKRDFQRMNPNIEGSPSKVTTSLDVSKPSGGQDASVRKYWASINEKGTPLPGTVSGQNQVVQATKTGLRDENIRQSSVLFDYIGERSDLAARLGEDYLDEPINRQGEISKLEQLNDLETKFFGPEGSSARSKAMSQWLKTKGHTGVNPDVMLQHVEDAILSTEVGYTAPIHDIGTSKHLTTTMNRIKSITDPTLPSDRWSMEQEELVKESDGWHIPQEGWSNNEIAEHNWELESSDQAQHHNQMADDIEDLRTGGSLGGPKTEAWYSGKTKAEVEGSLISAEPSSKSLVKEFLQDNRKYLDWASGKGVPSKGLGKDILERVIKSLP